MPTGGWLPVPMELAVIWVLDMPQRSKNLTKDDTRRPMLYALDAATLQILWRTPLPNGGQSRIAVWGDRLFPTTFDDYRVGDPKFSASIQGHCLDARTGKLLSARHR